MSLTGGLFNSGLFKGRLFNGGIFQDSSTVSIVSLLFGAGWSDWPPVDWPPDCCRRNGYSGRRWKRALDCPVSTRTPIATLARNVWAGMTRDRIFAIPINGHDMNIFLRASFRQLSTWIGLMWSIAVPVAGTVEIAQ